MRNDNRALLLLGEPELPALAFRGDGISARPRTLEGGGGGGSSSSTETSTSTQNIDKRQVVDTGSIGVTSDSSTVNVNASYTDAGAIALGTSLAKSGLDTAYAATQTAIDLSKSSTEASGKNVGEVLGFAKDVLKVAADNISKTQTTFAAASDKVGEAYKTVQDMSTGQRWMVAGGLVLAAIVAVKAMGGKS